MRTVAFGDVRTGTWGAALSLHPDLASLAVLGPELAVAIPAELGGDRSSANEWRITGDELELTVSPEPTFIPEPGANTVPPAPQSTTGEAGPAADGFDQLVTVRGRLGGEHPREVVSLGCRSERPDALEPGRFRLMRSVSAWFAAGEGLALVAVRPRRARGHGDEHLTATLFSGGQPLPVAEPRLSTTYTEEGQPVRATLELWLPEQKHEGSEDEQPVQYPRRAAGEARGSGTTYGQAQLELRVQPFRWRAEGRDGAGMYMLAQAR